MVEKRPGEEFDDCSIKQPRYSEPDEHTVLNVDTVEGNASHHVHHYLGHEGFPSKTIHQCNGRLNSSDITQAELLSFTSREIGRSLPGTPGNSSWVTREENIESDAGFRILLSPDYYNDEDHVGIIVHPRVLYYSVLDIPPQKRVPLGVDSQAEIPESCWDRSSEEYKKFEGVCVIPMTELEVADNGEKPPGSGRTDCSCEDIGSTRCVKQHVEESRAILRTIIGTESFCKLGLDEMGEAVAEKWSEEEKELFHEVIYLNPESAGMNFWDQLAKEFPLRTKKEIVSFYFNVFILRKRAEQNRCSERDIDSDNDELESADEVQGAEFVGNEAYEEENIRINSADHANDNQSILNPDENDTHTDDFQNGCSDMYFTDELNGAVVETETSNTCAVDGERWGLDSQTDGRPDAGVASEKGNCNENWSSKVVDEHDPEAFPENEGFLRERREQPFSF